MIQYSTARTGLHFVRSLTRIFRGLPSSSQNFSSSEFHRDRIQSSSKVHEEELTKKMESNPCTSGEMSSEEQTSAEGTRKRPPFGNRYLENPENVFQHNAWDNVTWDPDQLEAAKKKVEENSAAFIEHDRQESYETEADQYWDKFYSQHQNKFFKDRHWLFTEFPELSSSDPKEPEGKSTGDGQSCDKDAEMDSGSVDCAPSETTGAEMASSSLDGALSTGAVLGIDVKENICKTSERTEPSPSGTNAADAQGPLQSALEGNVSSIGSSEDVSTEKNKGDLSESPDPLGSTGETLSKTDGNDADDFPGKSSRKRILEVGCGVGNTIFPILQTNADPGLFVYGCDFSPVAVDIVRQHAEYDSKRCHAFVCDVSSAEASFPFPDESLDIIVMIFVMSAVNPDRFQACIKRLGRLLRPGGRFLFRDYGRYDMAQLRFKKGRCLSENFYVRGDGTRVYFFTQDELRTLFTGAGLVEEQNLIDRRLQVNRGRQITMYRVWIQCKYRKPETI